MNSIEAEGYSNEEDEGNSSTIKSVISSIPTVGPIFISHFDSVDERIVNKSSDDHMLYCFIINQYLCLTT